MQLPVTSLTGEPQGAISLQDSVFALEPRVDMIARMIRWQLAKRQAGTHQTKGRADIARTGKKMYKQKGTGGARHGSARVPQFRGGGRAFGPLTRSHGHDLPKKVRALALRHALSAKAKAGALRVVDDARLEAPKTKLLLESLSKLGLSSALFVGGAEIDMNFGLASRNIHTIDVLPVQGINVYDVIRRDTLVLTKAAVEALEARLS